MRIQFDPKQQYQLDAVNAVVELFDGQPLEQPDYSVIFQTMDTELFAGQARTELGVSNRLLIGDAKVLENLRRVQGANDLDLSSSLEGWTWNSENTERRCPHFSVEMETGTGKTYVYLRTIYELNQKYGFKKFIIVVPSVAIREGVLKNLEITLEHFRALYNNVEFESFVYDAKKVNKLRQFATSNTIQVLVINIDAFRKNFTGTDAENRSNVIYKENDKLSGRQPIEFVQATRPIVIIDEPQSVDSTDKAQEAIKALNPLCTLRYSATHRNTYNLVYRLDPIRAYELRLVKQIVVASATAGDALNGAYVKVKSIGYEPKGKRPFAKLTIHVQGKGGVKEKDFKVKGSEDLHLLSGERAAYQDNWVVDYVDATPGAEHVAFTNGRSLNNGQEVGGMREDVWRVQIENTVRKHLEKELQVRDKALKVLTLFFIDRVANYRAYDEEGKPTPGKFAIEFEAAFRKLVVQDRYRKLPVAALPLEQLHNGYFAQDKKGVLKDTSGATQADDDVYALIMRKKEQLLSLDEPAKVRYSETQAEVRRAGIGGTVIREKDEIVQYAGPIPDVVAYLQNATELTRSTLVRILKESGRLADFFVNPQKFMDEIAAILNRELHRLMIDGIKYERLGDEEWSMRLFEEEEIVSYLNNRLDVQKSVYDAVVYDSEIEREFAAKLDQREDIKLFVKLPDWFKIDTPLGSYNPDWAILRHDNTALYLVRETKGTKNFEKLRGSEAEKIRCGRKHFETLHVDFDVVTSAAEVA
jgi:type III restriction enzyme